MRRAKRPVFGILGTLAMTSDDTPQLASPDEVLHTADEPNTSARPRLRLHAVELRGKSPSQCESYQHSMYAKLKMILT